MMLLYLLQFTVGYFWLLPIFLFVYLFMMLVIVQVKGDRSIANVTWVGGVLLVALYCYGVSLIQHTYTSFLNRAFLLALLITIWASRLILYVYLRYKGQDPRYQAWKNQHGLRAFVLNVGYIFILNGIMICIMSLPALMVSATRASETPFNYFDLIGIAIWLVGFYFEAVSDAQLFNFTSNAANKGKIMQYGLWRYSRHPNYFGEVLMWWGIYLITCSLPFLGGIIPVITPLTITFLLRFVTGVPWVEQAMEKNPGYQEYKKHTNTFIPWFPH